MIDPETVDLWLRILFWCLVGFAAIWAITTVIGRAHRRAYNLTHAESARSGNIKPDFLQVDPAKRQAMLDRGQAFDDARQPPAAPVEQVSRWSRTATKITLLIGLLITLFTTFIRLPMFSAGVEQLTSWERLSQIVSDNKPGVAVALVIIAVSLYEFFKQWKR